MFPNSLIAKKKKTNETVNNTGFAFPLLPLLISKKNCNSSSVQRRSLLNNITHLRLPENLDRTRKMPSSSPPRRW